MIEIIPAIDLIDGKCVRLSQGDFTLSKVYSSDPVETARGFEDAGVRRLHIVDLDGARRGKPLHLDVLEGISSQTQLIIDFSGGLKTARDLEDVFNAGASIAAVGSVAAKDPQKFFGWIQRFGGERILLAADVRNRMVAVDGWQTTTDLSIIPFLKENFAAGVIRAFITDVDRDGELKGPAIDLYQDICEAIPELEVIASGGVYEMRNIEDLEAIGCSGVIVGKAIYEGTIDLTTAIGARC